MLHKLKNVKESYKHNIDYQIQITIKNQKFLLTDVNQLKETKKYLWNNFLDQEIYQILTAKIIASENSYLLKNSVSYQIINDPDSIIALPDPKIIDEQENIIKQNLMWIIPVTIGSIIVLGIGIFFIIKKFKRKIK